MADITKCEGTGCIIKNDCYRYTAEDSLRQAYFEKPPLETNRQHDGITCEYYWQNK
jgi:hypothetical protein